MRYFTPDPCSLTIDAWPECGVPPYPYTVATYSRSIANDFRELMFATIRFCGWTRIFRIPGVHLSLMSSLQFTWFLYHVDAEYLVAKACCTCSHPQTSSIYGFLKA